MSRFMNFVQRRFGWQKDVKKPKRKAIDYSQSLEEFKPDNFDDAVKLKEYLKNDGDLYGNVKRLVDNVMLHPPELVPKEGVDVPKQTLEERRRKLRKARFNKKLKKLIISILWSGNGYAEISFDDSNRFKNLYMMDAEYIKYNVDEKGEIKKYIHQFKNEASIYFNPENVVHLTFDHLDTSNSGFPLLHPIKRYVFRKEVAEYYLETLIALNKLTKVWILKGEISDDEWENAASMLRSSSSNPHKIPMLEFSEDVDVELKQIFDTSDFNEIFNFIQEQRDAILAVLQVPPIVANETDDSNRSNSEVQARMVFYNTIRNMQREIIEDLEQEFLEKIGWTDVTFKIPHSDKGILLDAIKIASGLRELGYSREAIHGYLLKEGFDFPEVQKMFEEMESEIPTDKNGHRIQGNSDSREPRDKKGLPENEEDRQEEKDANLRDN